ncbi:Prefoldin subunit-domain-containing protein [Halteromyces radiatus]|uniref:Prefoldin subunit-domain-containing protein n=1 Tax=Halteromyces radiatus TaxID=101107 RepID=UPI00221E9097|nr:Prefoldin subunit-domain-containing protein [Halteromyces radiatus]KAI8096497.1 Prefoldin subunit-domain-containing protein [Halteromyces radiatus]
MSNIRMLNQKEEADSEVEVSWADQQQINAFSKLNAKIDDLEDQHVKLKQEKEYLDDVGMELELADEDEPVRHKVGDAFIHIPVSEAVERVEKDSAKIGLQLEEIEMFSKIFVGSQENSFVIL